ncbi:hypothetical protein AB6A40_000376 [Gnathostoma spinigerum]|uniref:Large ribosomal subunit protein uL23m n=1 Tax=Gnathostoma spinigerum TaxID=75299 RepID=A0ABD6EAG6_9BILA
MATRTNRLWQPGNPQLRIFLPDFWMKVLETAKYGRRRLPPNVVKFEVDPRMSRCDVRQYLEKIYGLPVRDVHVEVVQGEIQWQTPKDERYKKAMWKNEDKKVAYVYMAKGFNFKYPDLFEKDDEVIEHNRIIEMQKKDVTNEKYVNRDRQGIGSWFGV